MAALLWNCDATAQSFVLRYANTTAGAVTFAGNTLGLAKLGGANQPGALDSIGAFITLNTNSQVGTYPPGTTLNWSNNSSAALVHIPTNSTVLYAELVWAGSAQIAGNTTIAGDVRGSLNTPVQLILPDGSTNLVTPDPATATLVTNGTSAIFYVRSAQVTTLVQKFGAGFYAAGGVPGALLASEDANNACGWTLAVVYGNPALHSRNLSLFVGNSFAISGGTAPNPVSVAGFCAPPFGAVHGQLLVSAVEGDANKTGDQMLFGPTTNSLQQLSGSNNQGNNFFASQINGDNGLLDTNGTFGLSNSTPGAVSFCARQGWDITSVDVSAGLTNGLTSAYAQNITAGDGYSINTLALQIDVGSPVLGTLQAVDKGSTYVGDILTYTVTVTNSGTADAVNLIFTDPLPFGTSFVTNSFTTNGVTIPGANPVNGVPVPIILQGTSYTATYKVVVNQIPPSARFITAATIDFQYSGACAQSPIINSTLVNADVQTLVPLLNVAKSSSLTNVIPGAIFTYNINIPNVGTTNTSGAMLIDPLPVGVSYVTNSTTLNGTNIADIGGTNMPFTVSREIHGPGSPAGQINSGDTAVVTFQVKTSTNPPVRINNTATILANGISPTTAQNAAVNIDPVYCDLAAGIVGTPNPVAAGSAINYTVTITNRGPNSLNTITNFITLYLPLSSSVLSPVYTPSTGVYNPLNGVWSGLTLPSNGVVTLNISGTLSPSVTNSSLAASVTVSPPPGILDTVTNNNSAATTNAVVYSADLALAISDGVTNVHQGDVVTFIVNAVNLGPSTLTTITLTNVFSSSPIFSSFEPSEGAFNPANGVWNGLNMGTGDGVTLTFTATVPTNAIGALTNIITGGVPAGFTDPVLTNNRAADVDFVLPLPDLGVNKFGPVNVLAGTNFSYTLTVTNFGHTVATNVMLSDVLPTNVVFVAASGGGTLSSGTVVWNLGTLATNVGSSVILTVTAPFSGGVTNFATATNSTGDYNPGSNISPSWITLITPVADLAVGKTAPASVVASNSFSYTLSVTNFGPSSASGVVITDALPAGITFISASGGGTTNGNVVSWALGTLASGQVKNVTLTVLAPATGSITNIAQVSSPVLDPISTNSITPPVISIVVPSNQSADVAITKTGPASVLAGTNFSYTITITNLGPAAAANLAVSDVLPTNVVFVGASGGGVNSAGTVFWNFGMLAVNDTTNLTLAVTAPVSGFITNTVSVSTTTADPNLTNNMSPLVTSSVLPLADLQIGKTGPPDVFASSNLTYTISVTNFGPSSAAGVVVTDTLPTSVSFMSASGNGTRTGILVKWSVGTLVSNQVTNVTVTVTAPASGTLTNVASVGAPAIDPNRTNNVTQPVITAVTPLANLAIVKLAPATVLAGSNFSYTISITNLGPSSAGSVVATDTLPVGVTFVSASGSGASVAGKVTWSLGTLTALQTTNLTLIVTAPVTGMTLTNVANVSSPTGDPVPTNGVTPPVITAVTPAADVRIAKTGPAANTLGASYNYTLTVSNAGPSAATSVTATDSLPAGLTFVSSVPVTTTNASNQVIWNLGTFAAGAASNLTLTVFANQRGSITNVAAVGGPTFDPVPTNSTSTPVVTGITNRPPVAVNDSASTSKNVAVTVPALANDSDPDGDSLTIVTVAPTNGLASISGANIIFTPTNNFLGTTIIGYTISDGFGGTSSAFVFVTVTNRAPIAVNDATNTPENIAVTVPVLVNDSDPDGDTLTIVSVSPTNGTAIISGTNVVFTPATNFVGTTTVGYSITDGFGGTNSALITISVTNRPPVANPDGYSITENTANIFNPLTNDVLNTPGGTLTIVSVAPTNGTVTIIGGTNISFIPATNFLGTATIGYTIIDKVGGTNTSLITVTVTNIPPVANPDSVSIAENTANTFTPLTNDVVRTPGGTLTIINVNPTNGTATIVGGTNILFVPSTNFFGTATIGYTIIDGIGGTNTSLITVSVTNRPPMANPDGYSITENTTNTFSPLTNDVLRTTGGTLIIVSVNPTNGTATIIGVTNITFVPATNFFGTATIGYTITDGVGGTNTSLITIAVTNIPPVANPDGYAIVENTTNAFNPLTNDVVRTPGGTLIIISVNPTNGTATIIGGTNILFVPSTNFFGTATIGYTITDGIGGTNTALITVSVANLPPVANPDGYSITENTTNTFSPLTNDINSTTGGTLSIVSVSPTNGTATIIGGTNITFIPATNFLGMATIGYTITDGIGGTNTSLITISVTNIPPTANPDGYGISENTTNIFNPLTNDIVRTPGGTLTIISVNPTNGTATIIGGTNIVFIPNTNFLGTATIGYTITDGIGGTNTTLITVSVTNRPPVANPDSYSITENTTNTFTPLTNDLAITPGGSLTIVAVNPTNGTAIIIGGTNITFVPNTNFLGTATIGYTITDGAGGTNTSLITVLVTNIPPVANPDFVNIFENTTNTFSPLTNDIVRTTGGTLAIIAVSPTNGLATIIGGTNILFVPNTNFVGTTTVGYTIIDGIGGTNTSLITVSVTNRPPIANPDSYSVTENTTNALPVLINDAAVTPGGTLKIVSVNPTNGTATILGGTNIVFVPATNFLGTATIGYTITDGVGGTNSSLATVIVTNIPPLANPDFYRMGENTTNAFSSLTNDVVQTPGGVLSIVSVSPTNGTATVIGGTNVTFVPTTNFFGTATIGYTITDGIGGTNTSLITIMVTNNLPAANPDGYAMTENTTNIFNPLTNDIVNTTGGTLSIVSVSPTNGTATIVGGTNVVFAPTTNFLGVTTIGYTITDGVGGTNTSLITVLVTNIPPVANPDGYTILENSTNTFNPLTNDVVHTTGGTLTILSVNPTNGTATISGTNIVFTPTNNFTGTATIGYIITDGIGGTNSSVITITVLSVADIAVTKSGAGGVYAGTNFDYTITVTNLGPGTAANVSVTDSLPAAVTFSSATAGGVFNGSQVVWTNLGAFLPDAVTNLTVTVIAPLTGASLTNIAGGGSPTSDPNPTNNTSPPVFTTVTPIANLVIAKSAPPTVFALGNLTYTISVTNFGPSSATSVIVTDALPAGVAFVSASGNGSNFSGVVTWNFGTLTNSQSSNVTVTVTAPASGTLTNVASVGSPTLDPTPTNDVTPPVVTTVALVADLRVGKTAAASVFAVSNLTYTITVTNFGPSSASSVVVTDALPAGVTFVIAPGGVNNGGTVTWGLGTLTNNQVSTVNVTVTAPPSGILTNVASVGSPTGDPNPTNNVTPPVTTTVIPLAALSIAKAGPATVLANSNFSYTISVTNSGPSSASSVIVTDALPAAVTFVSASGNGSNTSGVVTWNLGTLSSNQITNLTVTVTSPRSGSLTNIASVGSPISDPTPTNNVTPPVTTGVIPVADVSVIKTGPAVVLPGTNFAYTITVTNNGPSGAANLSVTDSLPANVTFVSATAGSAITGSQLVWTNLGTLTANGVTNLTVTVTAPLRGSITNTASAGSPTLDPTPTNNVTPPVTSVVSNLPPVAINDTASTPVNVPVPVYPLLNDFDTNGDTLTIVSVSPTNGTASFTDTNVLFTPAPDFLGTATIGYTISDGHGGTNSAIIFISVTNRPPVANDDVAVGTNGLAQVINPLVNDTDPDGDSLTITSATSTNGIVVIHGGGTSLTFTPTNNGAAIINYTISDGRGGNDSAVIRVTVSSVADLAIVKLAPANVLANSNFSYTVSVTNYGPSQALSVIVTDTLPAGLTFVSASGNGSNTVGVVIWNLGTLTALQATNLTLTVTAPVTGVALTNVASIGSPTPDPVLTNNLTPPVVTGVTPVADVSIVKSGPVGAVFGGSYGYTLTVSNSGPSAATSLSVTDNLPAGLVFVTSVPLTTTNASNQVIWNLGNLNANTASNLTVTVISTKLGSLTNTAAVGGPTFDPVPTNNLTPPVVTGVTNYPPLANPDLQAMTENTGGIFSPLTNDVVRTPGGVLTIIGVTTTNGTASVLNNTNISFTPATNFIGVTTLIYTITDNVGGTSSSTLTIVVTNIPPLAIPDAYTMKENGTNTSNPLLNDVVQTAGGTLSIVSVSPTNGIATIIGGTNVVFIPTINFVGVTTVGYTITDNIGGTNTSLITITVTNQSPIAVPQSLSTTENTALPITLAGFDPVGRPLTYIITGNPTHGTLTGLNTNTGAVTYTPTNNFLGTDTFTFRVNNGVNNSSNATVTISVTPIADLLVQQSGPLSGIAGSNLVFTVAVTNLGPAGVTNLVITNDIDAGFTFVSASGSGVNSRGVVTWTIPVLPANGRTNLTVTVFAVEGGTFTNIASGFNDTPDLNTTNNDGSLTNAQVVTTVSALADVQVFKTGSASVLAGGTASYSILATNAGPSTAANVVVQDRLPVGATLQTASGDYVVSSNVIIWNATDLAGGAMTNYTVTLTAPFSGTLTNRAFSTSDTVDSSTNNNNGSSSNSIVRTTVTAVADLAVGKSGAAAGVLGMNFSYTISVTNLGPSTAANFTVTDSLPAGIVFISATPPTATNASNQVIWTNLGTLPANAVTNLTLTVKAVTRGMVTNIATVGGPTLDPTPTNNVSLPVVTAITNRPPAAVDDSGSTPKNVAVTIPALTNDTDPDGDTLTIVSVSPTNGTAVISGSSVIFTPTNDFIGITYVNYTISDGFGGTDTGLITINVTNRPPVAVNDSSSTSKNVPVTIPALVNDSDPDGDTLTIVSVNPTNGTAVISGTNVVFTPTTNFLGTAIIGYTITDGFGGSNTALIFVSVTNRAPLAANDFASTPKNVAVTIPALANDSDPDGDPLTIISVSPTNGFASISGTNVIYTPTNNFLGTAIIGYRITDGSGGTNSALIFVTVTNRAPVAQNDFATTPKNTAVTIPALANDSDPDSDALTLISVSPTNGLATISGTNVIFTPTNNFLGTTYVGYTMRDNFGGTNSAFITVLVTNRTPIAVDDSAFTPKNVAVTIPALANDTDPDGDTLTIISVSPTNGLAVISGTNVVFTPTNNFIGTATVGYTIIDGFGGTNTALITINVTNRPPVANGQSLTTIFNTAKPITLTGSDADGDPLTYIIVGLPSNGILSLLDTNAGTVTYTPTNNFNGIDTFTFRVNDGTTNSALATVSIAVGTPVIADLAVFKTGPTNGVAGSNLVYTITVTNIGPATATNVLVHDQLPAGFTFVSATPAGATLTSNIVNWAAFKLPAHAKTNFTLTAISMEGGTYTNFATATSDAFDPNPTNSDGSSTNSQVRTVISALADVEVFKVGGTNVVAGGVVNYTITATNSGPSTATNVIVKDNLPAGSTFQSASGSFTVSNNVVTWSTLVLTNGASVNYTIALTAPASGSFTNVALSTSTTPDPNPTNNNGSANLARVATKVVPAADLVVLVFGPTNAVVGSNFVYSLILSNAGPSVASNNVVSDTLPTNLVFVSATSGGTFSNGTVTWPPVKSLGVGNTTNYSITVYSPLVGVFTNLASAVSATFDPNPTNNTGVLPASQVQTTVTFAQFSYLAGTPIFNPQTGLYEENVIVTNVGTGTVAGFQLYVTLLTTNVYLWNATGTNASGTYVQYNSPVDPSNHVSLILEFYDPLRVAFTNTLSVVPIIPAPAGTVGTNGSVAINQVFTDTRTNGLRFVIEFASVPGKTYTIIYSSDMMTWKVATPSVTANANVTQWYDDGPPKTESLPVSVGTRFYRVIQN